MRHLALLLLTACGLCHVEASRAQAIQSLLFNSYDNIVRMNFSSGSPVISYTGMDDGFEAIAHAEDGVGNIVFVVNSNGVYDKNFNLMPGSTGLYADPSSGEINICHVPGQADKFYILYNDEVCSSLYYSIVDMTLNGGLGDVSELNTLLAAGSYSEGLEVVRVEGGGPVEYRLITYQCNVGFTTFDISATGFGTPQVIFNHTMQSTFYDGRSELDFHGGRLGIGFANSSPSEALLGNYNPLTNVFSNPVDIIWDSGNGFYGVEYSPDASKAYLTSWYVTSDSNLLVYDFITGTKKGYITPPPAGGSPAAPGQIELGPNGKLYFVNDYANYITEIENPNQSPVTFNHFVTTSNLALGVSDHIQSDFLIEEIDYQYTFTANQPCIGDSTAFSIFTSYPYDSVRWFFGDPESGDLNTSTDPQPKHVYPAPGVYTVFMHVYNDTLHLIDTGFATVSSLPVVAMPDSGMSCPYAPLLLDAGGDHTVFSWNTGEMTQRVVADEEGYYRVTVTNANGCQASDSTYVTIDCDPYVFFPNAFSPNQDNVNDVFKPLLYKVDNYRMAIYNRWGQEVFSTTDPDKGWNGKIKGQFAQIGVYVYYADITFTSGKKIMKEGNFSLLR